MMIRTRRELFDCSRSGWFVLAGALAAWLLAVSVLVGADEDGQRKTFQRGVLIRFEGPIDSVREQYLLRKLEVARRHEADLVVIEIESPGGGLEESRRLAEHLRDVGWARTVAFVPKMALSGAAVVSLGCDDIVMAPHARLGDAGILQFERELFAFRFAEEKIKTDVARWIRDLAEAKGRPPALAEAMVDKDLVVYHVRDRQSGEEKFMTDAEIEASGGLDRWEKLKPVLETREGKFFEVSGRRAVQLQLAQALVGSREELSRHYGLQQPWLVLEPNMVDHAVRVLNLPLVTGLLFVVGLIALYVELSAPGISVGGLLSGLCFTLFFWSRFMGGTAVWLEVILFLAGLVFLAMEVFVIPGFGVAGITGIVLVLASLVLASQDFIVPHTTRQLTSVTTGLGVVVGAMFVFALVAAVLTRYFGRLPVLGRLVLRPPGWDQDFDEPDYPEEATGAPLQPESPFPVEVGDEGVADSPLRPAGKVRFGQHYVDVVTDGMYVDEGQRVRIIDISGNRVMVRKVE